MIIIRILNTVERLLGSDGVVSAKQHRHARSCLVSNGRRGKTRQ